MTEIKQIEVVPYNPQWVDIFEKEALKIRKALEGNCIAIHHIGSTSIPGLLAKPRIDILAIVIEPIKSINPLKAIGFNYRGEFNIPMHYCFNKRGEVSANLHVYEEGHPEIELNLLFRDYLRNNTDKRNEYARLKIDILTDPSSFIKGKLFAGYTLKKGDFIRSILKQAGFNRLRILRCSDDTEWKAAKDFRQAHFFDKCSLSDPYTWTFDCPDHEHVVLYLGTEIIGYAHIQLWQDKRAALRIIVIDPLKRNQSFGRQFLSLIENWLKSQAYTSLHIESSKEALPFYRKQSYSDMPFDDPDGYESSPLDTPIGKIL